MDMDRTGYDVSFCKIVFFSVLLALLLYYCTGQKQLDLLMSTTLLTMQHWSRYKHDFTPSSGHELVTSLDSFN